MKITEGNYKNVSGIILENDCLQVIVLDRYGGKVASIYNKKKNSELLVQNPGREYLVLTENGSYTEAECSGFDDMFPTVDACTIAGRFYPDHGEVCRRSWRADKSGGWLELAIEGKVFPFRLSKKMRIRKSSLEIHYRLEGDRSRYPGLWAGHIMFEARPDDRLYLKPGGKTKGMFGHVPDRVIQTSEYIRMTEDVANYKFYFTHASDCFEAGLRREGEDIFSLEVSGKDLWFGIWVNQYGFHDQYSIALEPATAPYDVPTDVPGTKSCHDAVKEWILKIKV